MGHKSDNSLDTLMKRIYSFYIDIKSGDFREIDKDILLNYIRELYVSIKNKYSHLGDNIPEIEKEILEEKKSNSKEKLSQELDIQKLWVKEDKPTSKEEIDLTLFMDNDEIISEAPVFIEKEKPAIEEKKKLVVDKIMDIPNAISAEPNLKEVVEKSITKVEKPIIVEPAKPESEKKSTDKIMDFLHDGENQKKDIYSLLDINTRIGLVELFFKGNSLELTECLVHINKLHTKEECIVVLDRYAQHFGVKPTDEIYQSFKQLIERKFQYLN